MSRHQYCDWINRLGGWSLETIPENERDRELCLMACAKWGLALRYVPPMLRDQQMCLTALANDPWALEYVPDALVTREMCLDALTKCGYWIFQMVPMRHRDDIDLCTTAYENCPDDKRHYVISRFPPQHQSYFAKEKFK